MSITHGDVLVLGARERLPRKHREFLRILRNARHVLHFHIVARQCLQYEMKVVVRSSVEVDRCESRFLLLSSPHVHVALRAQVGTVLPRSMIVIVYLRHDVVFLLLLAPALAPVLPTTVGTFLRVFMTCRLVRCQWQHRLLIVKHLRSNDSLKLSKLGNEHVVDVVILTLLAYLAVERDGERRVALDLEACRHGSLLRHDSFAWPVDDRLVQRLEIAVDGNGVAIRVHVLLKSDEVRPFLGHRRRERLVALLTLGTVQLERLLGAERDEARGAVEFVLTLFVGQRLPVVNETVVVAIEEEVDCFLGAIGLVEEEEV